MIRKISWKISGARPRDGSSRSSRRGPGHQGAGDGEHLLFPAAERPARLMAPLLEDRKEREDVLDVPGDLRLVLPEKGPHVEILRHREERKDPAPFGDLGDAQGDDFVRFHLLDRLSHEEDLAAARGDDPADRHQGGRLARAVGADQGDDLPFGHGKADPLEGHDVPVEGLDIPELKHRHGDPPRGRP